MRSKVAVIVIATLASLLPSIIGGSSAAAEVVSNGLILNLDASVAGSYNGTTWVDQSSNGLSATAVNSPTYNAVDGSISFNGTNQYFNLGNVLGQSGPFSIEVTFTPNSVTNSGMLLARQNTGVRGNYFLGLSSSKVAYYVESTPWSLTGASTLTSDTKYVATMVYDSSRNITPYLNGAQNGTVTNFPNSIYNNTINLLVGAMLTSNSPSNFYSGKIYSVRMYNRALSASEVNQNYRATSNVVLSTASAASMCNFPSSIPYGWLLTAGTSSTITKIRQQYAGATSNSDFFNNEIEIYADNSGVMGNLLGTLTPETITPSSTLQGAYGPTRWGSYTGAVSLVAGSRFWMKTKANGTSISGCMSGGYITKASGWGPVLNGSNNILYNGTYTSYSGIFIYDLEISDINLNPTINTPTYSGGVSKGVPVTISVTTDTAGKVRFFVNGKRIAGCLARSTTGSSSPFTATCSWRPATQGNQRITAQLTTTAQQAARPISSPLVLYVQRRTTTR